MKKLLSVIIVSTCLTTCLTTTAFAANMPRSITSTTQGQACTQMLSLASVGRSYILARYLTPTEFVVRVGMEWDVFNPLSDAEKVAMLTALACSTTGYLDNGLSMGIQSPGGAPIGQFSNGQITTHPTSGFSGVSTTTSVTRSQTCFAMLGLANKNNNGLIARSFNSFAGYVAVVTENWVARLTNEQKIATLLTLGCGATGGAGLTMLVQDSAGNTIGRLVAGQLEIY